MSETYHCSKQDEKIRFATSQKRISRAPKRWCVRVSDRFVITRVLSFMLFCIYENSIFRHELFRQPVYPCLISGPAAAAFMDFCALALAELLRRWRYFSSTAYPFAADLVPERKFIRNHKGPNKQHQRCPLERAMKRPIRKIRKTMKGQ